MSLKNAPKSNKRILIDKSNASMVIVVAVVAFITVFSLISSKTLLDQRSYKARVIKEQKKALAQLKANNKAASELEASYKAFISPTENIIGGTVDGTSDKDGDNARIVLDALPSKYDFPALASSLEKILTDQNFKINDISGIDDELKQVIPPAPGAAAVIAPVEIPFLISVTGSFEAAQGLMDTFQKSIRPIKVSKISLEDKTGVLNIDVNAKTYYQPEKSIKITPTVVK